MGCADAVAAGVAATYHKHILSLGGDALLLGELHPRQHAVLLRQQFECEMDALEFAPRHFQIPGDGGAGRNDHGVEFIGEIGDAIHRLAHIEFYSLLHHYADAPVYERLVKLEIGNAVAQQSAGGFVLVKHFHSISLHVEGVGSSQSGGTGADHGHALAVAFGVTDSHESFTESHLGDGGLVLPVGGGLMAEKIQYAGLFAKRGAHATGEFGERICGREKLVGQLPVAFVESVVPFGRLVAERASPVAERHSAIHAAGCLKPAVLGVKGLLDLTKIENSVVYRTVAGFLPGDLHKCFRISHN